MATFKYYLILLKISLIFSIFLFSCSTQKNLSGISNRPYQGLVMLSNSKLFQDFEKLRSNAEAKIKRFKVIKSKYTSDQVELIQANYNASQTEFNNLLTIMKKDLLNKDKRWTIINRPDDYAAEMAKHFETAQNNYDKNFLAELVSVTKGDIPTDAFLMKDILKYGKVAIAVFQKVKEEVVKYNNKLIDEHLISKHRFKNWDEI